MPARSRAPPADPDVGEIWVVLPLGAAIGLVMGLLGGGGSILTVPALVYLLGQDPTTATTASLAIVAMTSAFGVLAHARSRRVRWGVGASVGALGIGGSWAGSQAATGVDPQVLLLGFAVLMLVAAQGMLRGRYGGRAPSSSLLPAPTTTAPPAARTPRAAGVARLVLAATGVGLVTGFFGVGGGFVVVPTLVLVLGLSMPVAVGTSLLVIAINSATALVSRAGAAPDLDWALVLPFAGAAVVGVLVGSRLAGRLPERHLRRSFGVLLVALALAIGTSAVLALT